MPKRMKSFKWIGGLQLKLIKWLAHPTLGGDISTLTAVMVARSWFLLIWMQNCHSSESSPLLLITMINTFVMCVLLKCAHSWSRPRSPLSCNMMSRFIFFLNNFFTFLGSRHWGQWLLHWEGPYKSGDQDGGQRSWWAGHMQHGWYPALHQHQSERIQVTATVGLYPGFNCFVMLRSA